LHLGRLPRSRRDATERGQKHAWIEPEKYRRWVGREKRAFEDPLNKEMGIGLRRGDFACDWVH
jgi:hypothetical protein